MEITIPAHYKEQLEKFLQKCTKNIKGLKWSFGEERKQVFLHATNEGVIKEWHRVIDVVIDIPDENNWYLVAHLVDGVLFVEDPREKLFLRNGHGKDYEICDVCKRPQWKASYIIRNRVTDEELQVGTECARKFGVNTLKYIANMTRELYKSYIISYGEEDPFGYIGWPSHLNDPYAVRSIETLVLVQAAKKYYDDNNGVWKKGYRDSRGFYYPSESAAEIKATLDKFEPNEDDEYFKSLTSWLREHYSSNSDYLSDFDLTMKAIGTDYYMSAGDTAAAFFAIKNFETWKKQQEAREKGLYLPKRLDYVKIHGKIVNKTRKEGYFGSYIEYEILNEIDNTIYKRSGVVPMNDDVVEGFAYVDGVYKNGADVVLQRITKHPKKGVAINNIF